jgi:hypothetical protein
MKIIESACSCGEPIKIEINGDRSHRGDGIRPFYEGSHPYLTQLRCRKCKGWLADTCPDAAYKNDRNTLLKACKSIRVKKIKVKRSFE